jgi:hypothetical protein
MFQFGRLMTAKIAGFTWFNRLLVAFFHWHAIWGDKHKGNSIHSFIHEDTHDDAGAQPLKSGG